MRLAFVALMVVALVAVASAQQPRRPRPPAQSAQHPPEQDQKAIAELQRRDIEANMALDTEKLLALRTDDVVYLVPGRAPLVGQDAVRKYLGEIRGQLANWDMLAYEENWQEVQVVGDFAFEWGTVNIRARQEGEKRESAALRNVMQVLRRQPDGDWKISRSIWNIQAPQSAPPPPEKPSPSAPQAPEKPKD
ncbi:MAG TPA: SgcJ/EcaC family oxidoreductase [Terriglobales bacterium]